jgi:hypothetical protein
MEIMTVEELDKQRLLVDKVNAIGVIVTANSDSLGIIPNEVGKLCTQKLLELMPQL